MTEETNEKLEVRPKYQKLAEQARDRRKRLLLQRDLLSADLPLRYWNQQAHFTTPASGAPEKAVRGLGFVKKILDRFGIELQEIAKTAEAPVETLNTVLEGNPHPPVVMVDVEDAVALTEDAINKARLGAVRTFSKAEWGSSLPFFRPSGLRLESCIDDLLTVLPEAARGHDPEHYPVAGVVWPKCEHPKEIEWVCELLQKMEKSLGLQENRIKFEFLVESGHALDQLSDIAKTCAHRLVGIIWGNADYSADTNLPGITNDHPLGDWARHEIVNVTGALNVPAIDCMTFNYPTPLHRGDNLTYAQIKENKDKILQALAEVYNDAQHGIRLGMTGKWVGHPLQLLMVLAAYKTAIPDTQIQKDLREIEAYSQSVEAGQGATTLGEGAEAYMADRATDRHLRARLRRATAWGALAPKSAYKLGLITKIERRQLDVD